MKTVLITGSNGLLGQKLLDKLKHSAEYKVIATSKGNDRYCESGYIYERLDVTNAEEVRAVINKYQPKHVIHTAALTNVDACEIDKEQCYQLNVKSVEYLIEACNPFNTHFIHLSTDFVFDGLNGPYKEAGIPNPLSYYGQTKLESEKLLQSSMLDAAILRTILVYGVIKDKARVNIVTWAKNALERGGEINVVNDQFRNPTLAEDLADACLLVLEKRARGVFHISGKDYMSIEEIVRAVADYWKLDASLINPISSEALNQAAKRPAKTGFVLDKARKELGYQPHSFHEGLLIVDDQLKKFKPDNSDGQ
ncbi:SDR family oxidoreductase [Solitalea koreensis]|uniref:dTDP-4-dehydrorhamnose reductase n=1 Tax=Solitalea koreensis TaxID=543615 RepID=A0A521AB07_9SPHI|nr:SDR family oxidoreductase [Solitalea koreensis]SMO32003.1 dTDP-4-dehydrorhamnose reductase [Solitalea koreensis]